MRRALAMMALMGLARLAWTATGGPDAEGWEWIDSDEADGPPHTLLDIDATGEALDGDTGWVDLPFPVEVYTTEYEQALLTEDGALFFDGLPSAVSCPSSGAWSGVAAMWGPGQADTVRYATLGNYPRRLFVVDWQGLTPTGAPDDGRVQVWLQEARPEVVIALGDVDFGGSTWDGGASSVVGVQGPSAGLAWSCVGGLNDGVSAHFGDPHRRPASAEVQLNAVDLLWYGDDSYDYLGSALAGADLNGDGLSELLMGAPDGAELVMSYGALSPGYGAASSAEMHFTGDAGDKLGAAIALGDLDGDGVTDLAIGEPGADSPVSNAGAVHLLRYDAWTGSVKISSAADATLTPPTGSTQPELGSALTAGDLDGDGYADLAIGAPGDDRALSNAGAVWAWSGGASWSSGSVGSEPSLLGADTGLKVGNALSEADLDGDGTAELLVGAQASDSAATDAGEAWLVAGGGWSGAVDLATQAQASFTGGASLDYLGGSVVLGDLDGDGLGDLALGAPRQDTGATNAGAVYVYFDGSAWSGPWTHSDADVVIYGDESAMLFGSALVVGDLDEDGSEDLLIGAPGAGASEGGAWVFRGLPSATLTASDADHSLSGGFSAGASGGALALLPDLDGDGFVEMAVGARFASAATRTLNGVVSVWEYVPSWLDEDGDGLMGEATEGPDCDDQDPAAYPGAEEDTALDSGLYGSDQDCDGWVDEGYRLRLRSDEMTVDVGEVLGGPSPERFDWETASSGSSVTSLYSSQGLTLSASAGVTAQSDAYGADAKGKLAAEVIPSSAGNVLVLSFDQDVDAISWRLLDGQSQMYLEAVDADGLPLIATGGILRLRHDGPDVPGGRFVGVVFGRSARELTLSGDPSDGFGLDDLDVYWAEDSDRDGDGLTGKLGDCDDSRDSVYPGATEDLNNGLDDDCDGVVDGGGATLYTDLSLWQTASGLTEQLIDFEDLTVGDKVSTDYQSLGVEFDGLMRVVSSVDGAAPNGAKAGRAFLSTTTITFEEVQPAVALQLLDGSGSFTILGQLRGSTLYTSTLSASADDVAGGTTLGYVFDLGVDTLVITGATLDVWGVDDLRFSALGLDDADGDGFTEADGDCDDNEATAFPGAEETWYDGIDGDCAGDSDYDADGDGHDLGADCDDVDSGVNPDAEEVYYDGVDADCDGLSDYDSDGDGYDRDSDGGKDCDDSDDSISPDASEVYYDGVDDNCDPLDDDDADGDGYAPEGLSGALLGSGDCDDGDSSTSPDAEEVYYDGVDSDCDEESDYDADLDGYIATAWGGKDCDDLDAGVHPKATDSWYDGIDQDCAGDSDFDQDLDGYDIDTFGGDDCDDTNPNISPAATESDPLDGIDEDCDGVDEFDFDGDGHRGDTLGGDDCDDSDALISPSAAETCYDGIDQDCDGLSDDLDCDGDGHDADTYGGDDCDDSSPSISPSAREYAYDGIDQNCDGLDDYDNDGDGHQVDYYGGTDCDDEDPTIYAGALETWYDGVDQDCDGRSDYDADKDGYDSALYGGKDCDDTDSSLAPDQVDIPYDGLDQNCDGEDSIDGDGDGYSSLAQGGLDCDDNDGNISPDAAEVWYDGVDQDCDGRSDYDADKDGQDGEAFGGKDCDDSDPRMYAGAPERWYDGIDQDCFGGDDYDQDSDGYRVRSWGGEDCDDTDATVHPGVVDGCGLGDEDCDGDKDEDCVRDSGDSGDSDPSADSASPKDSGDSTPDHSDSAVDVGPDSGGPWDSDPAVVEDKPGSCGCGSGASPWGIWPLALLFLRRRGA